MDSKARLEEFADRIKSLCSHVSVREDENGPYIFALGLKGIHTLQLRQINRQYEIELWQGDPDSETVVDRPRFDAPDSAFHVAQEWLRRDAT